MRFFQSSVGSKPDDSFLETIRIITEASTEGCVCWVDPGKIILTNKSFRDLVGLPEDALASLDLGPWMANNSEYLRAALIFYPAIVAKEIQRLQVPRRVGNQLVGPEVVRASILQPEELHLRIVTHVLADFRCTLVTDETGAIKREREVAEFLNLAAHHIRTPLNEIKWALESLKEAGSDTTAIRERALETIENTLVLTEGILTSIQIESGSVKVFAEEHRLADLIERLLKILAETIRDQNIKIETLIAPEAEVFAYDERLLGLVLYPIIENAIRYNQSGGQVKIEAQRLTERSFMEITITDTGMGMTPAEQSHIFEKYFRSEAARSAKPEGFGLGLYLAKRLIERLGGSINFTSKAGAGTTFYIYVPVK